MRVYELKMSRLREADESVFVNENYNKPRKRRD